MTEAEIEARIQAVKTAKIQMMVTAGREKLTPAETDAVIAQVVVPEPEPEPEPISQPEIPPVSIANPFQQEYTPTPTITMPKIAVAPAPTKKRGRARFTPDISTASSLPGPRLANANHANHANHAPTGRIAWQSAHNNLAKAALALEKIRDDLEVLDPITRRFVAAQLQTIATALINE